MRPILAALVLCLASAVWAAPVTLKVGSKSFNENVILGEMAAGLIRRHGGQAEHVPGLGGTQIVWRALLRGEIDVYPEYTGTLIQDQFHDKGIKTLAEIRKALGELGLGAGEPIGFSNSFGIGMRRTEAERLGIQKISDLVRFPQLKFGFSHEFMTRKDGWPALRARYGLAQAFVSSMEHDLVYRAIGQDDVQVIELFTTDAEVDYYKLQVLQDDLQLFPHYNALFVYRLDASKKFPPLTAALKELEGKLDDAHMVALNSAVKIGKTPEATVAANYLSGKPLQVASTLVPTRFWRDTFNHLCLVIFPLILDILVAIPLGIIAVRRPRLGDFILGICGVFQTIPSLALLVFMVPILGIGYRPALVALFLYGLLPILRNTCTGLREIPKSLLESADALGLPENVRLMRVELPLACRSILAGIKTAAVINVGTATIGAIIGAGGYGEPIMIGIRRDDVSLLLQGAVPAAVMAVLIQSAFEMVERVVVPKGLRLQSGR